MANQQQPPSWQSQPPAYPPAPPHPGYGQQAGYPAPPPHPGYGQQAGYPAPPPGYPPQPGYPMAYPGAAASYGGFWIRFVALFIDGIIIGIPMTIIMFLLFGGSIAAISAAAASGDERAAAAAMIALFGSLAIFTPITIVVGWLYEALMTSSAGAGTLGKRAVGLRVVCGDGSRVSFGRATGRHFAKIISAMILYIGFLMAAFTDRKRSLHDMICDTVVVKR